MTEHRFKDILFEALQLAVSERTSYIARACGDDAALRHQVEALLKAHDEAATFLSDTPETSEHPEEEEQTGANIGPYTIERQIGEGGFGMVYLARQDAPVRRIVALKLIKRGMDTHQVVQRFAQERQALAMMDHPGIARVFDAGETSNGRPYFAMEYVDGSPITDYCDDQRLSIRQRLDLFGRVCMAVQHAHQKGIIHRDIKPSNVLVMTMDGKPQPKVIDFGVAKAIEPDAAHAVTQALQILGTPQYMSPEQATPGNADVDTRSDVYSLGILLYELLAGVTPFEAERTNRARPGELERLIREEEPARPSTRVGELGGDCDPIAAARRLDPHRLWRSLNGDLDWIIMRAIEKEPARRYPTANALAEDLRRFMRSEPVEATPPSRSYRLRKFVRRNRLEITTAAIAVAALLALGVGGVLFGVRERSAAQRLDRELSKTQAVAAFAQEIISSVDPAKAQGADTTLLEDILGGATDRVQTELDGEPEFTAIMLNTIGYAYLQIGKTDEAERLFRIARQRAASSVGPEAQLTLDATSNLAVVLVESSRLEEASPLLEECLEIRRRTLGPEHEDTLTTLSNLAGLVMQAGDFERAKEMYLELLDVRRRVLGERHPDTLTVMNNLANLYSRLDDDKAAIELFEPVLEEQLATLGEEHPRTLMTMNNIAGCYHDLGRIDEAEAMFIRLLEVKRRVLPAGHPSLIVSRHNLAGLYTATGRAAEAETVYRELLEVARDTFGDRNMRIVAILNGLSNALVEQEKAAEAEPILSEAVAMAIESAGEDHPNTVILTGNLAALYADMERYLEAERLGRRAASDSARVLGPTHSTTVGAWKTLAEALVSLDRLDEAESVLLRTHANCRDGLGPNHERTHGVAEALVDLYEQWDRTDEADRWREMATLDVGST